MQLFMKKLLGKISIWPFLLAAVAVLLCALNYTSNTWLSGWDTLHPELNFFLYFKRIFFGVWQEHQGLGALATQAHIAEIPRMLLYYPLSFIFPDNFLRYSYFFLTLIIGPLGMFYFLREVIFKNSKENIRNLASFSGGLFYLLNLGTLQQYYLPLEMFATHFATLPWLFLFASKILQESGKKNYLIFLAITFFNAPISHTPTLFYAYFLGLTVFLLGSFIQKRNLWKKCLAILGLTITINSFWFLPHLYFIFTSGSIVQESKISSMFSETAFLTGQKFGNLKDTLFLKNYLFEWGKFDNSQKQFVKLFEEWNPHLERPEVVVIQFLLAGMVLIGLFWSVKNKKFQCLPVLGVFLVSFLLIANNVHILRNIYEFLQNKIPLFKEALRFPYTKLSILLMFSQAVFFGVFWEKVSEKVLIVLKRLKEREIVFGLAILITAMLVYFMLPAFKGNLINKDMKVKFPPEYFSAMEYLNSQEGGRIALLPIHQYWGWIYHSWGYEGAGFEWFGLSSPLLNREFDRWNPYNEQFYWEASYAVYSKNRQLFENVLEKYQVQWLMLDESTINPSSPKTVFSDELKEMFLSSKKVSLAKVFGKIKIYKVDLQNPVKDFAFLAEDLPAVGPDYAWGNYDKAYVDNGNYFSCAGAKNCAPTSYYPFRSLFTGRTTEELDFEIEENENAFIFKKKLPAELSGYQIILPSETKELLWINPKNLSETKYATTEARLNADTLEVVVPKVGGYFSAKIDPTKGESVLAAKNCNQFSVGEVSNESVKWDVGREAGVGSGENVLRLTATDANNCSAAFWLGNLLGRYSYLIKVNSRYQQGKPLLFWLENSTLQKADMELYLTTANRLQTTASWLIQSPMGEYDLGYALHFDNISIGRQETINDLGEIEVQPIPYRFLTGIVVAPKDYQPKETKLVSVKVTHPNPSVYEIKADSLQLTANSRILVLSQSFHPGWKAYQLSADSNWLTAFLAPIFGKEIKNHVLVNNWENGWVLPLTANGLQTTADQKIILIFWPQYLEYLGFVILISCYIAILLKGEKQDNKLTR